MKLKLKGKKKKLKKKKYHHNRKTTNRLLTSGLGNPLKIKPKEEKKKTNVKNIYFFSHNSILLTFFSSSVSDGTLYSETHLA